jgi:pectate lyase
MFHHAPTRLTLLVLAGLTALSVRAAGPTTLPAFPGAEGFGAYTPGGRGGEVYEVTNLNDSGPGSLREAVRRPNRTVVFRVSGTIELAGTLRLSQPFLTIAGQTAPGGGICLRNYSLDIRTHDVVIRHLRCRLGDGNQQESDGLTIGNGARNVIVDHCSVTWSVDECLSTAGDNSNITVQWCLIAEPLNRSIHAKGEHAYGSLARANGPVSWYHNLWAHAKSRNPRLGDNYGRGDSPFFDVRYNVMYDYGDICSGLTQGVFQANYIGNYIRPGPSSKAKTPIHIGAESDITFYLAGNIFEGNEEQTRDNHRFVDQPVIDGKQQVRFATEAFPAPPTAPYSSAEAYAAVLAAVGAVRPARDATDARIIEQVRQRTGKIINSQNEVGGWPVLASAPAPADTDHDGLPDDWEQRHGLDRANPADGPADADADGYTNLEEYLNGTDPRQFIDYRDPANNIDPHTANLVRQAPVR